jgi:hypothetical protein
MSGAKCVPREPDERMTRAMDAVADLTAAHEWRAAWDAAPACECEAQRLLRELVEALDARYSYDSEEERRRERMRAHTLTAARTYLRRKP